ncbi:SH3-domain GRB2-like 3, isoform CRA_e [Rattus norvegicus]|uniref:SH3-domain GRB2-like 3, isoform CRA_e n=1 Tax=Rattus norvegicus TaxID=10116 RepID=A6JCJ4_RAT|nr:SH3-domain GRB2-like 3, isoform CRA_e [Rattus norvegicus]
MSVAGLKKQFHKASQLFSEKISGAEGTKLDEEFLDMEKVEQVSQLAVFVEAALDYHRQSTEILQELQNKLELRIALASQVPRRDYMPKPVNTSSTNANGVEPSSSSKLTGTDIPSDQPCCRGLYDFEPENEGELGFKEGDIITLTNQIDENWYEGMLRGESGFFPINYVEVIVPLPR